MTAPTIHATASASRQRGAVLFVSLIFLLVLTLLGVMLARTQTTEARMAQNDANHDLAVEAAGAALRFAEINIAAANYTNFPQNTQGLYQVNPAVGSVYTPSIWTTANATLTYTGTALTSIATPPQFIIEQLQSVALPGTPLGGCTGYGGNGCVSVYQITSNASGGDSTGQATLRSIYEKD